MDHALEVNFNLGVEFNSLFVILPVYFVIVIDLGVTVLFEIGSIDANVELVQIMGQHLTSVNLNNFDFDFCTPGGFDGVW
eukprot:CAMPEP_0116911468 /NCGR_PEP_ID=MMETSP0467-20121206/15504_1 /TAXON_ID=283647 /ORGANISM="Mesodinium pulex, Strain SPMC105" /LENGTH=79 /DNA_ID=CAMNT_0004587253 /DNA_START=157 /DNA_END=393 /DNA_ORIENTATION=+